MMNKIVVNTDIFCNLYRALNIDSNILIRVGETKETMNAKKVGLPTLVNIKNKSKEAVKKVGQSTLDIDIKNVQSVFKKAGSHTKGFRIFIKLLLYSTLAIEPICPQITSDCSTRPHPVLHPPSNASLCSGVSWSYTNVSNSKLMKMVNLMITGYKVILPSSVTQSRLDRSWLGRRRF